MTTYFDKRLEEVDDEELAQVVADADLPSLLPAVAYALGDASWLPVDLRPQLILSEGRQVPQGGMSAEAQARGRELAVSALKRLQKLRDADRSDREQVVHDCLEFVTSGQADMYRGALRAELGLTASDAPPVRLATPLSVLVVGAGISGIAAAHELTRIGARVTIVERNSDVGGVWLENNYPGCRLDTPNFAYSFSFAPSSRWTHHFSTRDSILTYLRDVASQEGLNSSIEFDTALTQARWKSTTKEWSVVTSDKAGRSSQRNFDVVVTAVGQLNQPSIPDLPGLENFGGTCFHSARWDHDVDLSGQRVAVIGTGASSYQFSPEISARVENLTIFQRTAPWGLPTPLYHNEISTGQRWLLDNVPEYHRWVRFLQFWLSMEGMRRFAIVDPAWEEDGSVSALSSDLRAQLVKHLTNQFSDRPDLLKHVIPPYPPYGKRMLRDNGVWARMLKRDNVDLVTERIIEVTTQGIRTADTVFHPVDVIIFGTGFRASHFLPGMQIFGKDDVELHEHWAGEPRAFLGTSVPGFPNFFMLYGPNTNLVLNASAVQFSEFALRHITACVAELAQRGGGSMEIQKEPFDAYNALIDTRNTLMAWGIPGVSSWYKNASGRVSQNWPLGGLDYWKMTDGVNVGDFAFDVPEAR